MLLFPVNYTYRSSGFNNLLLPTQRCVRDAVVLRAGGRCEKCNVVVGKSGHVHHKRMKAKHHNHLRNLLLVCPSCHMKLHSTTKPCDPTAKNPHAVAMGKLGGPKGGKARAKSLSPERRSEIACNAVNARWKAYREREEKKGS